MNYSKELNNFLFRKTWGEAIALLDDAEAGKLMKAIFAHVRGESASKYLKDIPKLQPLAGSVIFDIEKQSKRQCEKWGITPTAAQRPALDENPQNCTPEDKEPRETVPGEQDGQI